jgi:hypothetical protein
MPVPGHLRDRQQRYCQGPSRSPRGFLGRLRSGTQAQRRAQPGAAAPAPRVWSSSGRDSATPRWGSKQVTPALPRKRAHSFRSRRRSQWTMSSSAGRDGSFSMKAAVCGASLDASLAAGLDESEQRPPSPDGAIARCRIEAEAGTGAARPGRLLAGIGAARQCVRPTDVAALSLHAMEQAEAGYRVSTRIMTPGPRIRRSGSREGCRQSSDRRRRPALSHDPS